MGETRYHKFLRVGAVLVTGVLIFDGGFIAPVTKQLSDTTYQYLAGAGASVTAEVAPTEYNKITAELTKREQELSAREASLEEREIAARGFGSSGTVDYSTYILSIILFILTVLILLNYAMDWTRVRTRMYERQTS